MTTIVQKKYHSSNEANQLVLNNIEYILSDFGIEYTKISNRIACACPIHDGDNPNGFGILLDGVGNWMCFTHHCHLQYGNERGASMMSLLAALLKKYKVKSPLNVKQWLEHRFDTKISEKVFDSVKQTIISISNIKKKSLQERIPYKIPKPIVKNMIGSADFYLDRGYDGFILDKYDVGLCIDENNPLYNRIITPYYDDDGYYAVGFAGRSTAEKCAICGSYHNEKMCPTSKGNYPKWKNSLNLNPQGTLYNIWYAKQYLRKYHTAIIVEGPADVWKIEQAGISLSLATFGTSLSYNQVQKLSSYSVVNLVICYDGDEAGQNAAVKVQKQYGRYFNIYNVFTTNKDPGDLTTEEIQNLLLPLLRKVCNYNET